MRFVIISYLACHYATYSHWWNRKLGGSFIRAISGCSIWRDKSIKALWRVWLSARLSHFHYKNAKPVTAHYCPLSAKYHMGTRIRYVWNSRNLSIPNCPIRSALRVIRNVGFLWSTYLIWWNSLKSPWWRVLEEEKEREPPSFLLVQFRHRRPQMWHKIGARIYCACAD